MPVIVFVVIIFFVVRSLVKASKSQKSERQSPDPGRPAASYTQRPYAPPRTAQTSAQQRSPYSQQRSASYSTAQRSSYAQQTHNASYWQFDSKHFNEECFDFDTCFSFKDVPKGADELTALIASNTRHEKHLEKLLKSREVSH